MGGLQAFDNRFLDDNDNRSRGDDIGDGLRLNDNRFLDDNDNRSRDDDIGVDNAELFEPSLSFMTISTLDVCSFAATATVVVIIFFFTSTTSSMN